jgi:hypothetical protein
MKSNPKFRVGQVVFVKSNQSYKRIERICGDANHCILYGHPMVAVWMSLLRPLTKRERGQ